MKNQGAGGQLTQIDRAPGVVSLESELEEAAAEIAKLFNEPAGSIPSAMNSAMPEAVSTARPWRS